MEYRELNLDKIHQKVSDIKDSLKHLRKYTNEEEERFVANTEAVGAARYFFIVLIEATMNIANHICARMLQKAPTNYAETFLLLGSHGIISSQLAEKLAQMARFRNLLVHGYGKIDDRKMLQIIREDLTDVDDYLHEVRSILDEEKRE